MMGTEQVPETSICNELTRLIAREDFINVYFFIHAINALILLIFFHFYFYQIQHVS
jgi:hypothetical protein